MNKVKRYITIVICLLLFISIGSAVFLSIDKGRRRIVEEGAGNLDSVKIPDFDYELFEYLYYNFPENVKTLEVPSYTLADDFPEEHIKTFHDFLLFCASVEETRKFSVKPDISVVKARLELNSPVRYEDFLAAMILSISYVGHNVRIFEQLPILMEHYVEIFRFPSRNPFYIENIVEPLSLDLKVGNYIGYHFKDDNLVQFFQNFIDNCYKYRYWPINGWFNYGNKTRILQAVEEIPEEFYLVNYYAQTFLHIYNKDLLKAYEEMYRYKMPKPVLENSQKLLPCRPYYFYSDEERNLWFEYLQSELISMGHNDFADEILKIELEHYRELINWQLQLRAYLTNKLYEYGDYANLLTLNELLTLEYNELKNDPLLQAKYEMAIEILRNIDAKVLITPVDTSKGEMTLPWIDRKEIDNKQGIRSVILSVNPQPITWRTAIENIDDQIKDDMEKSYRRSIFYIRALAVMCENLYLEKDLRMMVQLHSKLVNNKNISFTPTGVSYQDFNALKNTYGDGADYPDLDAQTKLNLRRFDLIANDFWGHQARRRNGDMTVGEIILPWVEVQDINP